MTSVDLRYRIFVSLFLSFIFSPMAASSSSSSAFSYVSLPDLKMGNTATTPSASSSNNSGQSSPASVPFPLSQSATTAARRKAAATASEAKKPVAKLEGVIHWLLGGDDAKRSDSDKKTTLSICGIASNSVVYFGTPDKPHNSEQLVSIIFAEFPRSSTICKDAMIVEIMLPLLQDEYGERLPCSMLVHFTEDANFENNRPNAALVADDLFGPLRKPFHKLVESGPFRFLFNSPFLRQQLGTTRLAALWHILSPLPVRDNSTLAPYLIAHPKLALALVREYDLPRNIMALYWLWYLKDQSHRRHSMIASITELLNGDSCAPMYTNWLDYNLVPIPSFQKPHDDVVVLSLQLPSCLICNAEKLEEHTSTLEFELE
jgi:hypothetical protein